MTPSFEKAWRLPSLSAFILVKIGFLLVVLGFLGIDPRIEFGKDVPDTAECIFQVRPA